MKLPNGYGGVSKLSGNRRKPYIARITAGYTDEGVQIFKTLGYFRTKNEALDELSKYNKVKYNIDKKKLTFSQIYREWSEEHFKGISKSSVYGYTVAYNHCKKLYDKPFALLRTRDLQEVVDDCSGYSARRTIKVLFNVLYKFADENDIVEKKYSQYVRLGTPVRVHDKKPFTEEEIKILFENVDKIPFVDTVLVMCFTGMRVRRTIEFGE